MRGGRGGGGDAGEAARKEVAEDLVPMHHDAGDAGSGGGADSSDAHDIKPVADISENGQEVGPSQCSQKSRNAAGLVYARKHNLCRRLVVAPVAQGSPARGAGQSPSRSESANVPVSADAADHEDGETDIDIAAAAAERSVERGPRPWRTVWVQACDAASTGSVMMEVWDTVLGTNDRPFRTAPGNG